MHTQLPIVAQFCTAENNPSKSNSYPKHVYFFRSIQMTNFAALRAGHLSMKEYSWFVSSLLRVTAPDSTSGNSRNSGEIPRMQGVFSRDLIFPRSGSEIQRFSESFPEMRVRHFLEVEMHFSRGLAGVSRGKKRHATQ